MGRLWIVMLLSGSTTLAVAEPGPQPEGAVQGGSPMEVPVLRADAPVIRRGAFGVWHRSFPRPPAMAPRPWGPRPLMAKGPATQQGTGKGRIVWRPALAASAALAVAGAALAYWSTDEADAAYDRYLRSAGARRQQQAFERAERYDRIAGAAFLAMEAGIVLSACLVFF